MRKLFSLVVGLIILVLLIWGISRYSFFASSLGSFLEKWGSFSSQENLIGFSTKEQKVGSLGGFHLVNRVTSEDNPGFVRFRVLTQLNRGGIITENLATPLAQARLVKNDHPLEIGEETGGELISDLGEYRIEVVLSDSRTFDLEEEKAVEVYQGEKEAELNLGAVTKWRLEQPPDDATFVLLVGLSKKAKFRLHTDSNTPEIILLDILKT